MTKCKSKFILAILFVAVLLSCQANQAYNADGTTPVSHQTWDSLLSAHVTDTGWVDYKGFIDDMDKLDQYLSTLSQNLPNDSNWTRKEKLAYWINAYNAFTVKLIADNYPVESIKDLHPTLKIPGINTVWKKNFFQIGGEDFNLSRIEHKILRDMGEPRIHFAINCASVSCPSLRNEAYTAAKLDGQLNEQVDYFINESGRNKISKDRIVISKIFRWFTKDFTQNGTLIEFLNQWAEPAIKEDAEIDYMEYNWQLNGVKGNT